MKMQLFICDGYAMMTFSDNDGKVVSKLYLEEDSDDGILSELLPCEESELSAGAKEAFDSAF